MDFFKGSAAPAVEVFTEHHNNQHSPLVVVGGIHIYPEGFGLIIVLTILYTIFLRRNYKKDKPKAFYE